MDMRGLSSGAGFAPPHCFELCGKRYDYSFAEGEEKRKNVSLTFLDYPSRELTVAGELLESGTFVYDCSKVTDETYLISYCIGNKCVVLAVDVVEGTVFLTAASADDGLNCAVYSGGADGHFEARRMGPSQDLAGNTVDWTFGTDADSVARVTYGGAGEDADGVCGAEIVCGSHRVSNAKCGACRMSDTVYFQYAFMEFDGTKRLAAAISSFTNWTAAGVVFGAIDGGIVYKKSGWYGKFISYTEARKSID